MTDDEFQFLFVQAAEELTRKSTFDQVATWMQSNVPLYQLQAYCTRKQVRCSAGHRQIADCKGVLVSALQVTVKDMRRENAEVFGERRAQPQQSQGRIN